MSQILPYAAVLTILYIILTVRTIRLRRKLKISIGDTGNQEMIRAMRAHSNFSEYVPLGLIMIFFVESQGVHTAIVHVFCLMLVIGRVSHAYGISQTKENFRFRIFGMAITLTVLLLCAVYLLYIFLFNL